MQSWLAWLSGFGCMCDLAPCLRRLWSSGASCRQSSMTRPSSPGRPRLGTGQTRPTMPPPTGLAPTTPPHPRMQLRSCLRSSRRCAGLFRVLPLTSHSHMRQASQACLPAAQLLLYDTAMLLWAASLQDPHTARTQARGSPRAALGGIRSPHSSGRLLSPTAPLSASSGSPHAGPLGTVGQHSNPKAAAAAALSSKAALPSTAAHHMLHMQVLHRQQQQLQHAADPQRWLVPGSSGAACKPAGLPAAGADDDAAIVDALLKYKFYKQFGIDPQHVAPYREEWLQRALALVPVSPPPRVSQVWSCMQQGRPVAGSACSCTQWCCSTALSASRHPLLLCLSAAGVLRPQHLKLD